MTKPSEGIFSYVHGKPLNEGLTYPLCVQSLQGRFLSCKYSLCSVPGFLKTGDFLAEANPEVMEGCVPF